MSAWVSTRASAHGSLRPDHYQWICPQAEAIVLVGVQRTIAQEARMVGSLLNVKEKFVVVDFYAPGYGAYRSVHLKVYWRIESFISL